MPKRILVIRLSSLGDVILTSPVFRSLKAQWPDCSISVLVKPQYAPALRGNPNVSEVIPFKGLGSALALIRRSEFSHVLDLHGNFRSWLIRRLSRIAEVSVYRKDALARRLFVLFGLRSPRLERHTVERYLEALRPWGVASGDCGLRLEDYGSGAAARPQAARVLLIQSAFLGDSLLTLPLARQIKSLLPHCRLSVLTLEKTADIFRRSPWVDELILDHKRGEHGGLFGPLRLSMALKERGFDLAIVPHRSLRSALIARLSGAPRRVGFDSSAGRWLLTDTVPFSWLMHDLERNLALLKPLAPGLKPRADESLYVGQDEAGTQAMEKRLSQEAGVGPGERLIAVHPGSAWPTKRWLPERFAELCRRFIREGRKVILVGGGQDRELCARIARESSAVDWSGRTDLNELKALMGRLSLFVTNDSGPMHLAAACGVPVLALFGPTTRELGFFPYGPRHRVLEADLPCRPCGLHGGRECPQGHFLCMRLIPTDEVWKNAQELLAAPRDLAPR